MCVPRLESANISIWRTFLNFYNWFSPNYNETDYSIGKPLLLQLPPKIRTSNDYRNNSTMHFQYFFIDVRNIEHFLVAKQFYPQSIARINKCIKIVR